MKREVDEINDDDLEAAGAVWDSHVSHKACELCTSDNTEQDDNGEWHCLDCEYNETPLAHLLIEASNQAFLLSSALDDQNRLKMPSDAYCVALTALFNAGIKAMVLLQTDFLTNSQKSNFAKHELPFPEPKEHIDTLQEILTKGLQNI